MKNTPKYKLINTLVREVFSMVVVWIESSYEMTTRGSPYPTLYLWTSGREAAEEEDDSNFDNLWVEICLTSQPRRKVLVTDRPVML